MKKFASLVLGASSLLVASGALAADIPAPVVVPPPVVVVPPVDPGISWTGFYVGTGVGYWFEDNFSSHSWRVEGQAGFNFQVRDRLVVGVVAEAGFNDFPPISFSDFEWSVGSKAGVLLGDRVLFYGTARLANGPNNDFGTILGGGTEIAIGSRLSVFGEMAIYTEFSDFFTDFVDHILINGGINFHFGR